MVIARHPDIAPAAAMLADPTRARIVSALVDGRALPASVLADEAGVTASTTSGHLARLVDAGLLTVERSGRHRYYTLASPAVATAIEALSVISPQPPVRSLRESTRAAAMRRARTCYDHLAGRYGVAVTTGLISRDVLRRTDGGTGVERAEQDGLSTRVKDAPYELGPRAADVLAELGVDLPALLDRPRSARPLLRCCVDWSEQRHHLSGALGAAVLDGLRDAGWVRPRPGGRTVQVTDAGTDGLRRVLGVDVSEAQRAVAS